MSSLGRALAGQLLPLVLLSVVAGCSQTTEEATSAAETNLDEADTAPPDGPLAPDATFGEGGKVTVAGANAISAAKRADGSIGVLSRKGNASAVTIVAADGSAQADVVLSPELPLDGVLLGHEDGLLVAGVLKIDDTTARYFVSRVGADGAIDPTFTPDPLDLRPTPGAAAVTNDGKILVAGRFNDHAAIVRLAANGTLDTSFGEQGAWLAADDRAVVTKLALGKDGSIYAVTNGADKTQLAHFSAAGKPDSKFGTAGFAALPFDPSGASSALVVTDNGLRYLGPQADESGLHSFAVDARGTVAPGEAFVGQVIGFGPSGIVTSVTEGDACTVHVTAKATTALSADECSAAVSYVALGGGKRALVTNAADAVTIRVFGN